jgi:hypothetical protein
MVEKWPRQASAPLRRNLRGKPRRYTTPAPGYCRNIADELSRTSQNTGDFCPQDWAILALLTVRSGRHC